MDNILKPVVELEIAEMLPIKEAVEVIKTMNDDEKVESKDELPTLKDVVETIVNDEKRAVDEPEIQFHAEASVFTDAQKDTAKVTEIEGPNGETLELIVVNKTGVVVHEDSPCPDDDLEDKADDIADEIVDEIEKEVEEETKPDPEPESESSESEAEEPAPKPKKPEVEVYKTTVETLGSDPFALTTLVQ